MCLLLIKLWFVDPYSRNLMGGIRFFLIIVFLVLNSYY